MARPIGIELFCGVGGMSLGFEQAGFNVVAAFDCDPLSVEFHRKNFPNTRTLQADVSKLSADRILEQSGIAPGSVDVLFGGPPCQGFSEIGRHSNGDSRNLMILEFARIVRELRPRYFVVENVRGLLYDYSKPILNSFLRRVRRAGYGVVEPIRVLDATQYGVPQKRHRVFLLGYAKGLPAPKYPEPPMHDGKPLPPPTVADAIGDLPDVTRHDELLESDTFACKLGDPSAYAKVLRGEQKDPGDLSWPRSRAASGLGGCLRTVHTERTIQRFAGTNPGSCERYSRCYRLRWDGTAHTLRAGTGPAYGSFTAARPIHPTQPRCITTREAARLHGFPDWFAFHPTKWHGFRQVGNSVPPRLARAVAECLKSTLEQT